MNELSKTILAFKDYHDLGPKYVSGWCGHGFESHSQPFLLTCPGLIKAYDVVSSVFIYKMKALIAQLKVCLLDCFD